MAADQELVIDLPAATEVDLPDAAKPIVADPELPEVKTETSKPVIVDEIDEPEVETAKAEPEAKVAPKVDETALNDAIRARAEALAERDAAIKAANEEREARAKIETELRKTGDTATRAYWDKINADRDLIANSHAFMQGEMGRIESELEAAYEIADHRKVVALQKEMALQATKLRDLERGKEAADEHIERTKRAIQDHIAAQEAESSKPKPEPEKKADAPKPQTPDDWIAKIPGEPTQAWLKAHKDFVTDPAKNQQFIAFANYYGAKNGGKIDHAAFADALTKEFDPKAAETEEDDDVAEEAPKPEPKAAPRKAATAAPVSRNQNVFSSRNPSGSKIKLPPHVADFVRSSGLDPVKYAEGLVADIKAGKLPKNYLDSDYHHEVV